MRPSPGRLNAWLQSELKRASNVITYHITYLMELDGHLGSVAFLNEPIAFEARLFLGL